MPTNAPYSAYIGPRIKSFREEVFNRYGTECLQCGFDNDPRALHIDHIVGKGTAERRKLSPYQFYQKVRDNMHSGLYQVLCANCNLIKGLKARET